MRELRLSGMRVERLSVRCGRGKDGFDGVRQRRAGLHQKNPPRK